MTRLSLVLAAVAVFLWAAWATAGPKMDVVVGPDAPRLERFAAQELTAQLKQLFEADVTVSEKLPAKSPNLILVGSPLTNPAVKEVVGERWPKLSDQGHLLRSVERDGRKALVVGGGSPVATLWAVYELGHHFGIRSFLHGDVMPASKPVLKLDGLDVVLEPALRQRTWRTVSDFPIGFEGWGLLEQQRALRQLAKLKFNRVLLSLHPWQPFIHFEFKGVKKKTGVLWYGWRYPVDGDTAGRAAFRGVKEFTNPDLAGKETYEARHKAAVALATGIIDTAHDLGMSAAISLFPLEFPKEFAAILPEATVRPQPERLSIGPGSKQSPSDRALRELAAAQVRACLETYPQIDALYLSLSAPAEWADHAEKSWHNLAARGAGNVTDLETLMKSARDRKLTASGERGVRAVRANVAAVEFLHALLSEPSLVKRPGRGPLEIVAWGIDPALFPVLDRILPPTVGALHFIEPTAHRVAAHREVLAAVPVRGVRNSLFFTLSEDNVGILPQLATSDLHTLVGRLRQPGWEGYSTRCWIPGDVNPTLHYLSRAGFDATTTAKSAHEDLFSAICGEGVTARLELGFRKIEEATTLTDDNDFGFSLPVPDVVMKHYNSKDAPPEWWKKAKGLYAGAMDEMYRAKQRSTGAGADPILLYHAKRCEFAVHYLNCVEAVRLAGQAKAVGDAEKQIEELEKATEAIYNALNALGEVARDSSDRGVIAALNEHGYRPLKAALAAAEKAAKKGK